MSTVPSFFPAASVLVASSNDFLRKHILESLLIGRLSAHEARGGADALYQLECRPCRLLLLDHRLPDLNTDELVELVEARYPTTEVLMLEADTGRPLLPAESSPIAAQVFAALQEGAPLPEVATRTKEPSQIQIEDVEALPNMVGRSASLAHVYRMTRLVAQRDTTVLLTGETGTGKELVAEALHLLSSRTQRPFVTVNCAAIPDTLLEAELFGYTRGAFTGAVQARVGRIHAAQSGTLFLDEIGEMPLGVQAKLLRFLENGEVQRLGSSDTFKVDVRVIAATNAELLRKISAGLFREDLYYRLSVFPIELPALRERDGDLPLLAAFFLRKFSRQAAEFSTDALNLLRQHHWPGNVRELRHVIERACILADGGVRITSEHLLIPQLGRVRSQAN